MPPRLTLHFKKRPDGGAALTLVRADGSRTWQRQDRHAAFFAFHDLTHFAVETVLDARRGFYGLVAEGWEFEEFGSAAQREPLPDEALWVEELVALLDLSMDEGEAPSRPLDAASCNRVTDERARAAGREPWRAVDDSELRRIREFRDRLLSQYAAVPAGETFVLNFPGDEGRSGGP